MIYMSIRLVFDTRKLQKYIIMQDIRALKGLNRVYANFSEIWDLRGEGGVQGHFFNFFICFRGTLTKTKFFYGI